MAKIGVVSANELPALCLRYEVIILLLDVHFMLTGLSGVLEHQTKFPACLRIFLTSTYYFGLTLPEILQDMSYFSF